MATLGLLHLGTQISQKPLVQERSLDHIGIPIMFFLSSGVLQNLRSFFGFLVLRALRDFQVKLKQLMASDNSAFRGKL